MDNDQMVWKEVTFSCMKGVWQNWPRNEYYGTNCDNLDILMKEINEIAEGVDLDNVDPVGIAEVLESQSQPLSSQKLYGLVQQLTEWQKEDENEQDRRTKKCRGRTSLIFFPIWIWQQKSYVISTLTGNRVLQQKRGMKLSVPLLWNPARKGEKIKTFDVTFFLNIFWTTAWAFSEEK